VGVPVGLARHAGLPPGRQGSRCVCLVVDRQPDHGPIFALRRHSRVRHLLGLPDLYDYNGASGRDGGVGGLDMMDSNWGDHNCFSKFMLEWLTPTEGPHGIADQGPQPVRHFQDCVLVMSGVAPGTMFGEFYMAQYRQRLMGNDPSDYPTDGMLIWHIDSTLDCAGTDFLYDNSYTPHKLVRLMEADGLEEIELNGYADAGDFYRSANGLWPEHDAKQPGLRRDLHRCPGRPVEFTGASMSGKFAIIAQPVITAAVGRWRLRAANRPTAGSTRMRQ